MKNRRIYSFFKIYVYQSLCFSALKKSFASAIVPSDIANNYITNAPIISYENPLYDQKSMNDSDPFDEDFD